MAREYVTEDGHRYESLNDLMEFDHAIRVYEDGSITDSLPNERKYWPPEVTWSDSTYHVNGEGWSLMNGYSGQSGYAGPVMHPGEFIGGRMEQDIISTPGLYAAVIVYDLDGDTEEEMPAAGWAVAYKEWED